jgi:YidC/Oxa1 family membrane protein insertase
VLFSGPKEPALLQRYAVAPRDNIAEVVTYGWFAAFSKPLVSLLRFFYSIVGNYGIAIVMLTVIVRLILMPISRKVAMNAQVSAKMMQTLQPEIKRLAERYKDDMEKRMRAQQELFAKHGFNPIRQQFGGCLMVFLQLPIFIGLYRGLSVDVALRGQPLIPGLSWCSDLAAPDQLLYWKPWMPGFLANETGWFGPYLNLLPLITIALFLIQTKLFMPPPTDDQQRMAQRMMTFTMIFMSVFFFKVPSGLCLYFITSSIWGMVERSFLPKPKLATDAATGASDAAASTSRPVQRVGQR